MEAMKILFVDDEERLLYTTKKLFAKLGVDVDTANDGKQALKIMQSNPAHVVFMDIKMPGMDGMEAITEIKKRYPLTEVIIITGHATMETAVEGLKLGALDYLVKPVSMKALLSKAEEAFDRRKTQEARIRSAQIEKRVE